jgi:integrase
VVLTAIAHHMELHRLSDEGRLNTGTTREPLRRQAFCATWRRIIKQTGLPHGTRFHDLRHFYVLTLIAAGLHPKIIQTRLGHANITETMGTYGHLFPDAEDAGREALDTALRTADVHSSRPALQPG